MGRFGSGWAWLCVDGAGKLSILSTPNQDSPLSQDLMPLLGLDVWEHAYYLNYQNRRADYIEAWWNVVDWNYVSANYLASKVDIGVHQATDLGSNQPGPSLKMVGRTWLVLDNFRVKGESHKRCATHHLKVNP